MRAETKEPYDDDREDHLEVLFNERIVEEDEVVLFEFVAVVVFLEVEVEHFGHVARRPHFEVRQSPVLALAHAEQLLARNVRLLLLHAVHLNLQPRSSRYRHRPRQIVVDVKVIVLVLVAFSVETLVFGVFGTARLQELLGLLEDFFGPDDFGVGLVVYAADEGAEDLEGGIDLYGWRGKLPLLTLVWEGL